jgi:hypothetical protein
VLIRWILSSVPITWVKESNENSELMVKLQELIAHTLGDDSGPAGSAHCFGFKLVRVENSYYGLRAHSNLM